MKYATIAVAFLATFTAAKPQCKPGTYACLGDASGWQVCNTSGQWVFAGDCPPHTVCKFYKPSLSPYCVPPKFEFPQ